MADKELRKLLEQLHAEIERTKNVDPDGQKLLDRLAGEIRELQEHAQGASLQPKPSMMRGLEEAAEHFDLTHPELTMALSELLTALSNAGI